MNSLLNFLWIFILVSYLGKTLSWKPGEIWKSNPGDSTFNVYLFNITNGEQLLKERGSTKPKLREIGPFIYKLVKHKYEASQLFEDGSIKYNEQNLYSFDEENSIPVSLDSKIQTVNSQLLIFASRLEKSYTSLPGLTFYFISQEEKIFINATVDEIIFTGIDSSTFIRYEHNIKSEEDGLQIPGYELFRDGRYSYMKNRNGTIGGNIRVKGLNSSNLGEIINYNGERMLNYWNGSDCNEISESTDGSVISSSLSIFIPELCRSVLLKEDKKVTYDGIQAIKYILPKDVFSYKEDKNQCYCSHGKCMMDGVLDIQGCNLGFPYAISLPHFLGANSSYREVFDGLKEVDDNLHNTYYIVEPKTGTILESKKRFQINMRIKPYEEDDYLDPFETAAFPIFWTEEAYNLDPVSIQELKIYLQSQSTTTTTTTEPSAIISSSSSMITTTSSTTITPSKDAVEHEYLKYFNKIVTEIRSLNGYIWIMIVSTLIILLLLTLFGIVFSFLRLRTDLSINSTNQEQRFYNKF